MTTSLYTCCSTTFYFYSSSSSFSISYNSPFIHLLLPLLSSFSDGGCSDSHRLWRAPRCVMCGVAPTRGGNGDKTCVRAHSMSTSRGVCSSRSCHSTLSWRARSLTQRDTRSCAWCFHACVCVCVCVRNDNDIHTSTVDPYDDINRFGVAS